MRLLPAAVIALLAPGQAFTQTYTIDAFAGAIGSGSSGNGPGLGPASGVAVDSAGNAFFVLSAAATTTGITGVVLRLDAANGVLSVVAGNGRPGFGGDGGPAVGAQLNNPSGVAVDSDGNLYIADQGNNRIRKVTNKTINTVAGNGTAGFAGDGASAASAQLNGPYGVAIDPTGNLYIADSGNNRIRRVTGDGVIATVAGNGSCCSTIGDYGPAVDAELLNPYGVAIDLQGIIYIADTQFNRIRKITTDGVITTIAGNGSNGCADAGDNGPAANALFCYPKSIVLDSQGNLYIADSQNNTIRVITPDGNISAVTGNGKPGFRDGPAASALFNNPSGVAVDSKGNLFIADLGNYRVRKVAAMNVFTEAGGNLPLGNNGPAIEAALAPNGVAVGSAGNVYIADGQNLVRKVSNGVITTVAGNGTAGFSGFGGPPTSAQLDGPSAVATDAAGNLYIADRNNSSVREVTASGVIINVAGNGTSGFSGDGGPAIGAQLNSPVGVAVDTNGNLYISDAGNNRIRMVSGGMIMTVAGGVPPFPSYCPNPGLAETPGNSGDARCFRLEPGGIALNFSGSKLYIADSNNGYLRVLSQTAGLPYPYMIDTVAGNGTQRFSGDYGAAIYAGLEGPADIAVDAADNLYLTTGNRIRRIAGGVIATIAGNGMSSSTGNPIGDRGPATSAVLNNPTGIAVDAAGNVYVADNPEVRILTPTNTDGSGPPSVCSYSVSPTSLSAPAAGGTLAVNIQTSGACSWAVSGLPGWIAASASLGAGPATIILLASPNNTVSPLTATISVAAIPVIITQPLSASCTYAINPAAQSFSSAGGIGTIVVNAGTGCSWSSTSTVSWVAITSSTNGTGKGAITYQVGPNTSGGRSVSIAVAGLSFAIQQSASSPGQMYTISTIVGTGSAGSSGDSGPAVAAQLSGPAGVAVASGADLYIADTVNSRVRKVSNGVITTVAGNGTAGFSGDNGPATSAQLAGPTGVAVDFAGNLYVADGLNQRIRKVTNGVITTVAGNGTIGFGGDGGPATSAQLGFPQGVAVDTAGSLYIADRVYGRIRKVSNGVITTVAGGGSSLGDGGPATSAQLIQPYGVGADSAGNVYIADLSSSRIRKVSNGIIATAAGNGTSGFSGDNGPSAGAQLNAPASVAVDSSGNLYIADGDNFRIRKVSSGTIVTIAGNGTSGFSGDNGPATSAQLSVPSSVAVDSAGRVYVADLGNNRIRLLTPGASAPAITQGGIVPVYGSASVIQPGSWVSVFGTNMASGTATWTGNFPTSLAGTSVTINEKSAYLSLVSPGQINLQAPVDAATGSVPVVVTTPSGIAISTVTLSQIAPSFLLLDSAHVAGIILRSDGSGVYGGGAYDIIGPTGTSLGFPTVAARAGDIVEIYGTGFGPTNPGVLSGQVFSGNAPTILPVALSLNGLSVTPTFAGLSGAGLYQINLIVPAGLGTGEVSLQANVGGVQTPSGVVISLR